MSIQSLEDNIYRLCHDLEANVEVLKYITELEQKESDPIIIRQYQDQFDNRMKEVHEIRSHLKKDLEQYKVYKIENQEPLDINFIRVLKEL